MVLMIVIGLAAIASLFVGRNRFSHLELKSCFDDVRGLRGGAEVRIAGVRVGTVRSVRASPQDKNCPAVVEMELATSYDLHVPMDAITEVNTAGLLGESFVNIDVSLCSGPPIENHGYLQSKKN